MIEADEYDTRVFDKRSKFVHYRPRTAVLNNLNSIRGHFSERRAIETQLHHLVRTVPANGLIVANGRDEHVRKALAKRLLDTSRGIRPRAVVGLQAWRA